MTTKSRSLPPNILVASRVQRLLTPLPVESQRTVLEFVMRSLEEGEPSPQYRLTAMAEQHLAAAR